MKHVLLFIQGCFQTFTRFIKRHLSVKRGFLCLVILLQYLILQRVSNPAVGDYQSFQQIEGTRNGAIVQQVDPKQAQERVALFIANLIKSGYDWQPGLAVEEQKIQYPKNFHSASFYFDMESDLRQKWLLSRVVAYQKAGFGFDKFLKGKYLSTVELSSTPMVKQLSNTRWQAEVVGVRVVVASDKKAEGAAFKEKLSFRFVIQEVEPRKGHEWGLENSQVSQVLNRVQQDGLKIIDFQEVT